MFQLKKSWDEGMLFFFQSNFFFFLLYMFLMDRFKITEYNLICKVFTEVSLIVKIPHSTVIIYFGQREKAILWPLW